MVKEGVTDIIRISQCLHAVPKRALGIQNHRVRQLQRLQRPNEQHYHHGDPRKYNAVVRHNERVPRRRSGRIQRHHQRPIDRIHKAHARRKQHGEAQNEPQGCPLGRLERGDAEHQFRGCAVEAQPKHDADRETFSRTCR
jgi:hypothetical protein